MAKNIKLTSEAIEACKAEFEKTLKEARAADGIIKFSTALGVVSRKASLYFTEKAWVKMQFLISNFQKEIAWHGVAYRGRDAAKDDYYITDILVYPQEVSGSTVDMNVEKYDEWLRENFEDERFDNIRMQGHSHVNMGVTASGVDLAHQEEILSQLKDDMFYIFMIWNKKGENQIKIYDMGKNVLFEDSDITYEILEGDYCLKEFVRDAKDMVTERVSNTGNYSNYYYYDDDYEYHGYRRQYGLNTGNDTSNRIKVKKK